MKTSSLKKSGKITLVILGISLLSIVVWANWNAKTYTERNVADTVFITYDLSAYNETQSIDIEKEISRIEGVSTCSYNSAKKIAGIIFYTSKLSSEELQNKIKSALGFPISEKAVEQAKNGCPVGGIKYVILHVKELFRFRS
ncbi:MAG: hypothetical protein HY062_10840 [Bacteroidetes bacterium]|nr:hypothetical protein [Bacteroidota bacterium]